MARFNEILVGRYNRFAQKLLSMKGGASMPTLSPDLAMVIPLYYGAENRYLEGWDLFGRGATTTALAANVSVIGIRNPIGSNVVAVVSKFSVSEGATDQFQLNSYTHGVAGALVDQGTVRTTAGWDNRGRSASTCIVSDNNGAAPNALAGTATLDWRFVLANTPIDFLTDYDEIVLQPGSNLTVTNATAAVQILYGIFWRERFLEESERA